MNPYLDHLLDLVEPDGSYCHSERGATTTGLADVERAGLLAALVELHAIREALDALASDTPAATSTT